MFRKTKGTLLIISIFIAVFMSACSSKSSQYITADSQVNNEVVREEAKSDRVVEDAASSDAGIQFDTVNKLNRKVIKKGFINLQTKTFDQTVQGIMDKVDDLGGFIQNCSIEGNDLYDTFSRRHASLSIRIPNIVFDKFMNESNEFGNVTSKSVQGEDVTDQYMDTEIRLETLEIQAARLKELLKQAGDLDKLFKIEKELANVTYEIESLKGTLKKYDNLIDYSTIDINVEEAETYKEPVKEDTFIDRIKNTFMSSVKGLISLLEGLFLVVIGLIPFLIIIVPLIVIGVRMTHRKKAKSKDKEND